MSQFPEKLLNNFRCCKCFCVASKCPLYSGQDGSIVCGRCPPSPTEVPNPPLEAFLGKFSFPCIHQKNGCQEIAPFNEVQHEEICQFRVRKESPFEVINETVWLDWKCCKCQNLLTVGPISLTEEGESICGRCVGCWSDVHVNETLIRNWELEYIMKQLPLTCMYRNLGCNVALKWGEVEEHEDCCPHRLYRCPATPYDSCRSVVPAGELYYHYGQKHKEYLLTKPEFRENLNEDSDTHRLVRLGNHLFVLMSRVRVPEHRLWFSAAYIGDHNMAKKIHYVLKISNHENQENAAILVRFNSEKTRPNLTVLRIDQETAQSVSFECLKNCFNEPNLGYSNHTLKVQGRGGAAEPTALRWAKLKSCKWSDCRAFGSELKIQDHESRCVFRRVRDRELLSPFDETRKYTKCLFGDCKIVSLARNWNLHVRDCKHSYDEAYFCWLSGCERWFLPPALAEHILAKHPHDVYEGPAVRRSTVRDSTDYFYLPYDGLLFRGGCWFNSDGRVLFYLRLLNASAFLCAYVYTFKLIHPKPFGRTTVRDGELNLWNNVIPRDVVAQFVLDDVVVYEFTIVRK